MFNPAEEKRFKWISVIVSNDMVHIRSDVFMIWGTELISLKKICNQYEQR